jgi:methylated-DNA-[protein]-cysteine S-methyltransferase
MDKSEKDTPMIAYTTMDSAVGRLLIASSDRGLLRIEFLQNGVGEAISRLERAYPGETLVEDLAMNRDVLNQLQEYFQGRRRVFTLPLELRGTEFQRSVWDAVAGVPYGQTRSYVDIANKLGKPKACRAVGAANGANPIPIVIPCHRIIGSDGSMTGFGGGIPIKEKLLALEKAWMIKKAYR